MKKILLTSIFILTFCTFSFGQNSNCPEVTITGPASIVRANETAIFTINVTDTNEKDSELEYVWSTDGGRIVEGQGTQVLSVNVGDKGFSYATVKIKGLPQGCEDTFTEGLGCQIGPPESQLVAEFSTSNSQTDTAKLDKFIDSLRDNSDSIGYIITYGDEKTPPAVTKRREKQIRDYLMNKIHMSNRLVFVLGGEGKDLVRLWLVPVGAELPTP